MNSIRSRVLAVLETLAIFGLAILLFYQISDIEEIHAWETEVVKQPLVEYGVLLLFILIAVSMLKHDLRQFGFTLHPLKYQLSIFAVCFLPVFALSILLNWVTWQRWPGSALICLVEIGLLGLTARLLRTRPDSPELPLSPLLLLFPVIFIPTTANTAGQGLIHLAGAYLLIAPAEEALFRGFIQSRLNEAFGRAYYTWGIRWGWGLPASALLFGLWHIVLNPLNPASGPQALWTVFAGLIFGIVREKSGSIAAPALLHGVLNYGPQALLFDLISGM
jgi:membrane protease YdiL (CAAX protease family)